MLHLYYTPATSSMAAHIVLEDSGVEYQSTRIDIAAGQNREAEYLRIHPLGRVPALVVDVGTIVTENTAILPFLGKRFDQWPSGAMAEVRALELIGYFATSVHSACAHIGRAERFATDPACQQHIQSIGRQTLIGHLAQIDKILEGQNWFGGDYSVVDAYGFFFYVWASQRKIPLSELKNYRNFAERMLERAAVRKVLSSEMIEFN